METTTFCICPGEAKAWWMSCEISKEVKHTHATVHSALRTVVLLTSTTISHKQGGMFTP